MSKKRRRKKTYKARQRDHYITKSDDLLSGLFPSDWWINYDYKRKQFIREFAPEQEYRTIVRTEHDPVLGRGVVTGARTEKALPFDNKSVQKELEFARRFRVCTARRIRRAIIFALGNRGKGSGAKRRRFNEDSKVRC